MNVIATSQFKAAQKAYEIGPAERELRVQLAAAFRVAHHYRWNLQILNHITARIPGHPDRFLMNPQGLGWDEITASSLISVDLDGNILSHSGVKLAAAGLNFHSGILRERPDVNCVLHVHPTPGVVISATKQGLIIVDQSGCHLYGEVGTHDFEGFAQEEDEVPRILRDLGDKRALIMWNHGLLDRRPHHRGGVSHHAPPRGRLRIAGEADGDRRRNPPHSGGRAGAHPASD